MRRRLEVGAINGVKEGHKNVYQAIIISFFVVVCMQVSVRVNSTGDRV